MSAPIGQRRFTIDNQFNNEEQDANTALVELDRGLRSLKVGEQVEAVVRFPRLFEKYPFPILINSALLKLAEVFKVGKNFIRLCVFNVTQQSQKHLDKVRNVDDFLRCIFTVIHSNDPVARAITLRLLGSVASIISERQNVHHSIIMCLDSHDAVEVEAAIFAAGRFAAQSKIFSTGICGKLATMIQGLTVPMEMKLKLIPILQHMHHDTETSAKAMKVCHSLLPCYPAQEFVAMTLHTIAQLAAQTLIDIHHQVDLLLGYVDSDPRFRIKLVALRELAFLAQRTAHLWSAEHSKRLCTFCLSTSQIPLIRSCLRVLVLLADSPTQALQSLAADSPVILICQKHSYHNDSMLASRAVQLLTQLTIGAHKKDDSTLYTKCVSAIQSLLLLTSVQPGGESDRALRITLQCAVRVSSTIPDTSSVIVNTFVDVIPNLQASKFALICEGLVALADGQPSCLTAILPNVLSILRSDDKDKQHQSSMGLLCTLLLQAAHVERLPGEVTDLIQATCRSSNGWQAYKIGRQAMRYSQYSISMTIFATLQNNVSSEHFHFWLSGLQHLCRAEAGLTSTDTPAMAFIGKLSASIEDYHRGLTALKAASTPASNLQFHTDYVALRAQLLRAHSQLIQTCNTFRTCPPPAIATALARANDQEISRCGQIIQQLFKCSREFDGIGQKLAELLQESFDADPVSLHNIQTLKESCSVMSSAVVAVIQNKYSRHDLITRGIAVYSGKQDFMTVNFNQTLNTISESIGSLLTHDPKAPLTHEHMVALSEASQSIVMSPLGYPRNFFQMLQSTSITLAVSPQPKIPNDPISMSHDTQLTLKVEGVIQHSGTPGRFRQINDIIMSVDSVLQSRSQIQAEGKMQEATMLNLSSKTQPHNDYFSVQFLLIFPVPGLHKVRLHAAIIDENGMEWKTSAESSFMVKSVDELLLRQQQQAARAQQQSGQF